MGLPEKKVCLIGKFVHFKIQLPFELPAIFNNSFVIVDPTASFVSICSQLGIQTSIVLFKTGIFVVVLSL